MQIPNATGLKRKSGERSGEICGSSVFLGMFFDRGIMGLERRGSVVEVTAVFSPGFRADTLAAPSAKPFALQDSL
jgi:hypothetical protein